MNLEPNQPISITEKIAEFFVPRIRERRRDLERELDIDRLTGIANRTAYRKATANLEANIVFIAFDLNHFGKVNKMYGHSFGDELLFTIAQTMKAASRAYKARAFRLGGDEFVVLADEKFAIRLRDSIERKVGVFSYDGFSVSISGTVGKTFDEADASLQSRKSVRKSKKVF